MKASLKSSLPSRKEHFPLNCRHITTMDFMRLQPVYYRRLTPNSSIKLDANVFSRLADMPCPSFGEASLRVQGFFVPYRTVDRDFNNLITASVNVRETSPSIPDTCKFISNYQIVEFLLLRSTVATGHDDCDIHLSVSFGQFAADTYYKLQFGGKQVYKLLLSLGIQPDFTNNSQTLYFNALDILSYFRIYADWLYNTHVVNDSVYNDIIWLLEGNPNVNVSTPLLQLCVNYYLFFANYDSNRFTDAFSHSNGPNNSNALPNMNISVPGSSENRYSGSTNLGSQIVGSNPLLNTVNNNATGTDIGVANIRTDNIDSNNAVYLRSISEQHLQALSALNAYIRRYQLSGARAYERMYALFGIKPDSDVYNRSYYLGRYDVPLSVSDVTSTSSTSDAALGSYAGKGFFIDLDSRNGHFEFNNDTNDFGVFMLIATIVPHEIYPYGIDPMQLQLNRTDFYTGDFDGIGTEPISNHEIFSPVDISADEMSRDFVSTGTFGFTPRYSSYKYPRNWLTGDFRLHSISQAGITSPQWHFARDLTNSFFDVDTFGIGDDASQFDRIFYNTSNGVDHFVCQFLFKVDFYANMKKLYDFPDFDDDSENKDVNVEVEGIQK